MALWQQAAQAQQTQRVGNPQYQNITNMLMASRVDPQTALGYAIGRYLSNAYDRRMQRQDEEKGNSYDPTQSDFINQSNQDWAKFVKNNPNAESDLQNNTLSLDNGNVLNRNLMYSNQGSPFQNPAIQGGTSAGTTAIDSTLANAAGVGLTDQAKSLLGNSTTAAATAQQLAGNDNGIQNAVENATGGTTNQLLSGLGGVQSLNNLESGKANLGDLYNIYKLATFFDKAATDDTGTAASAPNQNEENESQERKTDAISDLLKNGIDIRDIVPTKNITSDASTSLDYDGKQMAQLLVNYKKAYDFSKSVNDSKGMEMAAQGADTIRKTADELGINVLPYGADKTFDQAQQALATSNYRGMRNILNNDISSDEYYNRTYDYLRKQGIPADRAKQEAARQAGKYQSGRLSRLENSLVEYGVDPNTESINDYGVRILMAMQQEDPNAASGLAKMYGLPSGLNEMWRRTQLNNNQALNTMAANSRNNAERYQYGIQTANHNADLKTRLSDHQISTKTRAALEEGKAKVAALVQSGVPENQAIQIIFGKKPWYPPKNSGAGSGSSKGPSLSDARATIKMAEKWDTDHPDQEWANPYRDNANKAQEIVDNAYATSFSSYGGDINDYESAYSAGTKLLEDNARHGYPRNAWEMEDMIKKYIPKFADNLIQQWADDGTLARYSNDNNN